ncbi:pleckstrin homology domain-containing family S member 1-like [Carassius carassius]|uniref:pleckstrin homology domain-containing family S member 1-like n=1 Tax=Carassius carassius TaxID=217509 RepID=UPI002868F4AC|nr:pleckstrin homology domain-containing family S member 1-like [Carassius carassius]
MADNNYAFYIHGAEEQVCSGYLYKSPPENLFKSQKSWKRRFFVLLKYTDNICQLKYYKNEEKNKTLGDIDLSRISLLFVGPEAHQKWEWIQKNFKCSPSSVLFLRVEDDTPKHSRDYFLIGKNSADVDGWLNALVKVMKTQKSRNTLQENRFRSASEPSSEAKAEGEPDDRRSAHESMLTYPLMYSHYDYPRKLSEPPLPVALKIPVTEDEDDEEEMQDESAEESNTEYMTMESLQSALKVEKQDMDTTCRQENEAHTHVEKEICVSQNDLKNSLILTQEEGKPCVSDCRKIQASCLFHKGDQILAFNDLLIDTVEEIQTYARRLSKDEVKLTIRRLIGSQPLHSEPCLS